MVNLVIQTAFVGDTLLSTALLKRLRRLRPDCQIWLLCRLGLGDFFLKTGLVDQVFEVTKGRSTSYRSYLNHWQQQEFNWVVVPHRSFRSAFFARRLRAELKIGYTSPWSFLCFDQSEVYSRKMHELLRQLRLIATVDNEVAQFFMDQGSSPVMQLSRSLKTSSTDLISDLSVDLSSQFRTANPPRIGVAVAPGSVWPTKMWPVEHYESLIQKITSTGEKVVLLGSAAERELCNRLALGNPNVDNRAGTTSLWEAFQTLLECRSWIGNDSGLGHLAAMAGCRTLSFFGPTVVDFGYAPWTQQQTILATELSCRPCHIHGPRHCPLGHHMCMKKISVDEAFSKWQEQ